MTNTNNSKLAPLDISCNNADCNNELHCFRKTRKKQNIYPDGKCQECGIKLIDCVRIRKRDLTDVNNTFNELKKEWIRHYYWHKKINQYSLNYTRRKGKLKLREAAKNRLFRSVGPAQPYKDGGQTPFQNIKDFFPYAQHATATCCRKCIEFWHGIPRNRELKEEEIEYLTDLILLYVDERIPDLKDETEYVPRIT